MKRALIIILLFKAFGVRAQTLKGLVLDGETGKPLFPVNIVNHVTDRSVITDMQGFFSMPANNGDIISFSFNGYRTVQLPAAASGEVRVTMIPLSVKLPDYVVHDYTPFQKDSLEMTALYSSELSKKAIKTGFSPANGGGFTGLIGGPVQKMSKSYKRNKRFKDNFRKDIEQKFIDTRYTQALVYSLTSFSGDTLIMFINSYPMDYNFARAATDLELKMWIRNNYKDYLHKQSTAVLPK